MTEKRFSLIKDTGTDECYCDNLYDNGTYIGAITGGSEMICYLLNKLAEENEQLKETNQELYDKLQVTMSYKSLKMGEVSILERENEQLKQALREQLEENGNAYCISILDKIFDLKYDEWQRKMNETHTYDYIDWEKLLKDKGDVE